MVWQQMRPATRMAMQEIDLKIRPFPAAERVWHTMLSEQQQAELGGDAVQAFKELGALGMWMRAQGSSNRFKALTELSNALWSGDWLMREASLAIETPEPANACPHWNPQTGRLTLDGEQIRRKAQVRRHPSNVQRILDAFQNAGWATSIQNPLDDVRDEA